MSNHVYHVTEVVGTSPTSVDDAIRSAIERSAKTLRNLDWFETTSIRGHLDEGRIKHFQVTLKVGFRLEELS
ncbi:dodecin [Pseudonocardia lacus]|jgi:dodecin|uniref:dodecin n=1 Tax=Pseudonocardia lacus TaxID=2835865 RepID=UPI001BDD5709|nr:dodecin [Pseudonocardia lacus]